MEFILDDGYIIKLNQSDDEEKLIAESFDPDGNFLERVRINKEDLYTKLIG
jgi:hypothetical protein